MSNIIDAIINLINRNDTNLTRLQIGNNRINETGYALEEYIKNLFADTFNCSEAERLEKWSEIFSYIGNDANPPDIMLKNGDAIEVKKIQSNDSALALNSSYPKRKLLNTDSMISNACREAENWKEKDLIYIVGVVKYNKIKNLCMIYGLDKWQQLKNCDKIIKLQEIHSNLKICDVRIKDPDNPCILNNAKLIYYEI